jgi:hypothetical protein
MAHELDSRGEWQRLYDHYHVMSDVELLGLALRPDDLTDVAREVLQSEMSGRKLRLEADSPVAPSGQPGSSRVSGKVWAKGTTPLMTFHDAIAAGDACDYLEHEGIEVDVRDVSEASAGGGSFYGGPPVALQVIVPNADQNRAMKILREKMGLFPLQEVEEADAPEDDGTQTTLGYFGRREEAEEVARVLEDAGVWHRIAANPEGTVESEDCYTLEVKEVDLVRAGELIENSMELE